MKRYKTKKKSRKIRPVFSFFIFVLGIYIGFNILDNSKIEISDKELVNILLEKSGFTESTTKDKIKNLIKNLYTNPEQLLLQESTNLVDNKQTTVTIPVQQEDKNTSPLIYIYNSHQTEEYAPSTFLEYSINPTVMLADYILEDIFNKNSYQTIVEENSIKEILNKNNWKYSYSYKASRILMEQRKQENASLKYFIDVHRDSLTKQKTTIEINGKEYAKTIFLIGTENPNYNENLKFTEEINNLMNEKYPNLSKGIYQKGGAGVNGIYNQDFSPYTILIEIGGYENTTTEVMNSTLAFAECFMEVIKNYENKTTS